MTGYGAVFGGMILAHELQSLLGVTPEQEAAPIGFTPGPDSPFVSFLVPAWNAATDIPTFVRSFQELEYPNRELILCAGGPDGSFEIASRYSTSHVTVIKQSAGQGKQGALRESLKFAVGDIIYLTDVDVQLRNDSVLNLIRHLAVGKASVVTGAFRPLDSQMNDSFACVQWAVEKATLPAELSRTDGIIGANAALSRRALLQSGGFDVAALSGTDYTLAKELERSGFPIWFAPGYPMPTRYPASAGTYVRRQARWIRNVFVIGRRYHAPREVRGALQTLVLPYMLLAMAVIGSRRRSFALVAAGLTLHAIFNRMRCQRRIGVPLNPASASLHFVATQAASLRAAGDIFVGRSKW